MFRKKKYDASKTVEQIPVERMASMIVKTIHRLQKLFVQLMIAIVINIGVRRSTIVFAVGLSVTGLYSLYLTGVSLWQPKKGALLFRPAAIQQPVTINKYEPANEKGLIEVDTVTSLRLMQLNLYFDSIRQSQPEHYHSILQSRPGLIDSIRMLHQIYYSQQKQKAYEK